MASPAEPVLTVRSLNVHYGHSHALQGVNLSLSAGILAVVGRNGMGKTTLCNTVMGLLPVTSGSISFNGVSIVGMPPADIARLGVGYVPQGRRIWRSLTVDEHLRLIAARGGDWTIERIYSVFPRLAERRSNRGAQLSGGEQQMLAIARALLLNPKLLVMDEPTEGLAPMIVRQVEDMLLRVAEDTGVHVLVIEQNIGVACAVSQQVAVMVNGRINRLIEASALAADRELQQSLLGVGRHAADDSEDHAETAARTSEPVSQLTRIYLSNPTLPTRWSQPAPVRTIMGSARTQTSADHGRQQAAAPTLVKRRTDAVFVAGTMDTKGRELRFMRDCLKRFGIRTQLVDLSTSGKPSGAEIPPHTVAAFHPRGAAAVFTGDRGSAVAGMAAAFERWMREQGEIGGIISAGGSGAAALAAPAMRALPVGVPKMIVSTVASGDVSAYVGPADIIMMHSIADIQGVNAITRDILSNAAGALAGMVKARRANETQPPAKPAIGLTMFGVTTACVRRLTEILGTEHDCLVFHATGTGGRSMEKLLDSGRLAAVIDITTTEVCDMIAGGVFAADEDRFGASIRSGLPYIGACGALDMVNFRAPETVPEHYRSRLLYEHNPQITLMRTTPQENEEMGRWIGERLNRMSGEVRFFLTEGGVSELDRPGAPFWDPEAREALFAALEATVRPTQNRQLIRVPHNANDPEFAETVASVFRQLHAAPARQRTAG